MDRPALLICIAGPSAAGKTHFSEALSQRLAQRGIPALVIACEIAIEKSGIMPPPVIIYACMKNILSNMHYNLGLTRLLKFKKMWAALEDNDFNTAADEMLDSRWATQVPNRANRLADRMRNI